MQLLIVYPESADDASAPHPAPLILFHHGFLLSADGYRSYAVHLASHGFVVALPTFPMTLFNVDHTKLAEDVRFVLDYCLSANADPNHPLYGRVDDTRSGTAGHSLGGKLSLLEAVTDDRIRAGVLLDPVDLGGPVSNDDTRYPSVTPELMPAIGFPLLLIGAELGGRSILLSPCAPVEENYQRFFEAAVAPAIEVTQLDVGHAQYVDEGSGQILLNLACVKGDVSGDWVRESAAAYVTAFFAGHLLNADGALDWLNERLSEDQSDGRILVRRK